MSNPETVKHIKAHLRTDGTISDFNMRCVVGMLETGEATIEDVMTACGDVLGAKVIQEKERTSASE